MDFQFSVAARTLWQEARGEPLEGQRAVAHVLINRRNSGRWGNTLAEVCLSEYEGIYQFSGWARNDPNRTAALRLADTDTLLVSLSALIVTAGNEPDPTNGATHYYARTMPKPPKWVGGDPTHGTPSAIFCGQFGNQLFYKGVK